jgi:serine/threonine protein kinase
VYNWQDDVEELENYRLGGYHPIQLGDEFSNARYCVVHKLGHGGSSTVWLARDRKENRYVSLKIVAAEQSRTSEEAKIHNRLRCGDLHHPGRPFVLSLLDEFGIEGPNGYHQCLVSEVVGPSILEVKEAAENGMLSVETAQRVTAQLALGLTFIHSCGIVHGGLYPSTSELIDPQETRLF